jgi:aldehyde:ferredoxin oxidoreductase
VASNRPGGEASSALGDSLVYCNMSGRGVLEQLYEPITGWRLTPEDWAETYGRRIIQVQRAALLLGGPDLIWDPVVDDDNPPRWYEPLPSGPQQGKAPDREACLAMRAEYYHSMGWDERGIPTSAELRKLGLDDVDRALEPIRAS